MLRAAAPWVALVALLAPAAPSLHLLGEHAHPAHEEGCPHGEASAHWCGAGSSHEPVDCDPALHATPLAVVVDGVPARIALEVVHRTHAKAAPAPARSSDPGSPTRGPPRA